MARTGSWARTIELFIFVTLIALGGTTIVAASWARDYSQPRATLLGSDRGISVLITAGPARVLIVNGTDPAALGNAVSEARHPGLDRLDLLIVSSNSAASGLAARAIGILQPRLVITVGSPPPLAQSGIDRGKMIEDSTEIALPDGITVSIDIWPAAGSEIDDVTWAATIQRGGATIYWVSDREALSQDSMPEDADVTVIGRGQPTGDTPFPTTRAIVVAGESISGPELRALSLDSVGPDVQTARVFAGEAMRIDLNPEGIRTVPGAIPAGTPIAP